MMHSLPESIEPSLYRHDGRVTAIGLMLLLGAAPASGALVGGLAGYVRTLIEMNDGFSTGVLLVFLISILLAVGCITCSACFFGICRNRSWAFIGGILTVCVTVAAMHFAEYASFQHRLGPVDPEVKRVAENFTQLRATQMEQNDETKKVIDDLARRTEIREAVVVDTFWKHCQYKAKKGVTLISKAGNRLNMGYVGSFIFWGVEAALIFAAGVGVLILVVTDPFCDVCQSWKDCQLAGSFNAAAEAVHDALVAGDFAKLATCQPAASGPLLLHLFHCPVCGDAASLEAKLVECSTNEKGEETAKTLCFLTFPREASEAFRTLFPPVESPSDA